MVGVVSWGIFNLMDSTVNANGVLHEPFFLIPVGWLLIMVGALLYAFGFIKSKQ